MVPEIGIEPTRTEVRWILSPLRLPVPPLEARKKIVPQIGAHSGECDELRFGEDGFFEYCYASTASIDLRS